MGVLGLTSFVDQNQHLLTDYQFHDCRVIIDGNNLFYFLYYYFKVNHQYAGDYDHYATQLRYFFGCLRKCQIRPYIVFDGAYDRHDRKLKTVLRRTIERIDLASALSSGALTRVLPVLSHLTFVQVLNEMGIEHVTCDGEADAEIAALANHWKCPVMSNDSDFFIFDLEAGLIIVDYMNIQVKKANEGHENCYNYLSVQRYTLDVFYADFQGMDKDMFPLFATLMGNDYVDSKLFDNFFKSVHPSKKGSKKVFTPKRQARMVGLLHWMESKKTLKNALDNVLAHFRMEKQDEIRRLVEKSMAFYTDLQFTLHEYFEKSENGDCVATPSRKSYEENTLPPWSVEALRSGQLPMLVVNALMLHMSILSAQVETMSQPSSYQCAVHLRQVLYGMLFTLDLSLGDSSRKRNSNKDNNIEEYDRVSTNLKKNFVPPVFQIHSGLNVPHLLDIDGMGTRERGEFLCHVLATSLSKIVSLPRDLQLLMPVIVYWIKNAQPKVDILQLHSLLLCVFNLTGIQPAHIEASAVHDETDKEKCNHTDPAGSTMEIHEHSSEVDDAAQNTKEYKIPFVQDSSRGSLSEEILRGCSMEEICGARDRLAQFMKCPKHNRANPFDNTIVHAFAQFQTCLHATVALCGVLRFPLGQISPAKIMNGTFMYNLYQKLRSQENPQEYICELLGSSSLMSKLFEELVRFALAEAPDVEFSRAASKRGKKSRKRDSKLSAQSAMNTNRQESAGGAQKSRLDAKPKVTVVAACPLSNKFTSLRVDEDDD